MKIGAVCYLNTKPLVEYFSLRAAADEQLVLDLPSRLARSLQRGEHSVGLIPVVEFFRGTPTHSESPTNSAGYRIISDAMIGCRGGVRSVRLFFRSQPEEVRVLAADEGSRTSIALAQVLLAERYGVTPQIIDLPIASDPDHAVADAVLVIGDRAMQPKRYQSFSSDWDLGDEWYQHTNLPFVFAAWIARMDHFSDRGLFQSLSNRLSSTRDDGLDHLRSIATRYAANYELTVDDCYRYFLHNLRFKLGDQERSGLALFHQLCKKHSLIDSNSQLEFGTFDNPTASNPSGSSCGDNRSILTTACTELEDTSQT